MVTYTQPTYTNSQGPPACFKERVNRDKKWVYSQYLPGLFVLLHLTLSSPVTGLDTTFKSVGGDRANVTAKRNEIQH